MVQKLNKTLDIPNIFQYIQLLDSQQFVASRLVWGDENDMARAKAATPRGAGFDLIIGADVIYGRYQNAVPNLVTTWHTLSKPADSSLALFNQRRESNQFENLDVVFDCISLRVPEIRRGNCVSFRNPLDELQPRLLKHGHDHPSVTAGCTETESPKTRNDILASHSPYHSQELLVLHLNECRGNT